MEKRTIRGWEDAERLRRFDAGIYPAAAALDRELYLAAAELLPALNFLIGEGHLSCLPLTAAAYEGLREGRLHEGDLRRADLEAGGYVYLCSVFAGDVEAGWELFRALRGFLAEWKGVMGAYAVTAAGRKACGRLGMEVVREDAEDGARVGTEIVPVFLERRQN
jgi:hypothetical protein